MEHNHEQEHSTDTSSSDDEKDDTKGVKRSHQHALEHTDSEESDKDDTKRARNERFQLIQQLSSRHSFELYSMTWTFASSRHILTLMSSQKWMVHSEKMLGLIPVLQLHLPGLDFAEAVKIFCKSLLQSCSADAKIMVRNQTTRNNSLFILLGR
jgi:hypothetical protein